MHTGQKILRDVQQKGSKSREGNPILTSQVGITKLLAHDEDDRVEAEFATWVTGNGGRLVDDHQLRGVFNDLYWCAAHWVLMPRVKGISQV